MKPIKVAFVLGFSLAQCFVSGCGQKENEPLIPAKPIAPTGVDLGLGNPAAAPPPGAPAPAAVAIAPAPPAVDFTVNDRPFNDKGRAMSDLEWLNKIVLEHTMMQAVAANDTTLPPGKKYNDPDEESAARLAALAEKQTAGALRDLSDLVKAGRLKSIPAAPAGKQYVLDQKTGMVVMVDQK
jgi:hypothetical protein